MKIYVTMKTPDALDDAIREAVQNEMSNRLHQVGHYLNDPDYYPNKGMMELAVDWEEQAHIVCQRWFEYNEYVTLEIDTDNETIRVLDLTEE